MNGKATLLVVAGFSLIFLIVGKNLGYISNRAVDNSVEYYNQTVAHEFAVSAANLAANKIFFDNTWTAGISNKDFKGGEIKATVETVDAIRNIKKIVATGEYNNKVHKVEVTLAPSSFSKFAYLSTNDPDNLYWDSGDTIYGPFHSQGDIYASRHPVFWGKATTNGKVICKNSVAEDYPYFNGGFESGIDLSLPSDGISNVEAIASSAGKIFNLNSDETLYLTFKGDSINYKIVKTTLLLLTTTVVEATVPASTFSSNGVIFVKGGDIKMKGTVKGQFTVGTDKSVFLEDDVVYKTNPLTNPSSTDILGIVSKNDVRISNNLANSIDINVHASIYCENGGFGAGWGNANFIKPNGMINLIGGIQNKTRVQIGMLNGNGFRRAYKYDSRLASMSPPAYPGTGMYEIVSWHE